MCLIFKRLLLPDWKNAKSQAYRGINLRFTWIYIYLFLYTLLSLLGNLDCLSWVRLQQLQEHHYPVPQVHAGSFCVSVIHRTHMDYRIFNMWTWSFLSMHIHTGVGHTDKSAQHFWLKNSQVFLVLLVGFRTLGLWIWSLMLYPFSHPVTPIC